jgi:hypothetical protein
VRDLIVPVWVWSMLLGAALGALAALGCALPGGDWGVAGAFAMCIIVALSVVGIIVRMTRRG